MTHDELREKTMLILSKWKPGYPPGKYYEGMLDDYEVYFSVGGVVWHRRKMDDGKEASKEDKP